MTRVWTYWEGPLPAWVELCLDTIRANIPGVDVLNLDSWNAIYDGLAVPRETINRLLPNQQSDFIRAWLLYHVGGIWIDADAIVLRDVRPITANLVDHDFVAYEARGWRHSEICTALIAGRPGSPIGRKYLAGMVERLNGSGEVKRLDLGPRRLWDAIEGRRDRLALIPQIQVHPFPYWLERNPKSLAEAGSDRELAHLLQIDAYCFMLTHRALGPMVDWSREVILNSTTLPAVCFRRALNLDTEDQFPCPTKMTS